MIVRFIRASVVATKVSIGTIGLFGLFSATAVSQTAESISVGQNLDSKFAVYRDTKSKEKFYVSPFTIRLAKRSDGREAIGVQYYKTSDVVSPWSASITFSIVQDISNSDLEALKSELSSRFGSAITLPLTSKFYVSYSIVNNNSGVAGISKNLSTGNLSAGATIAITLEVSGTAKQVKDILSGTGTEILLSLDVVPNLILGNVRSGSFSGQEIAEVFRSKRLLTSREARIDNVILQFLRLRFESSGAAEDAAARDWLFNTLESPQLILDGANEFSFGWNLSERSLQDKLQNTNMFSIFSFSQKLIGDRLNSYFKFGNICNAHKAVIVNLENGSTGCDTLQ
jgi:hypothetical protein